MKDRAMNERLRTVITHAESLSDDLQETLAEAWEEVLEELEWEALMGETGARAFHDHVRDQYRSMRAVASIGLSTSDSSI